MNRKIIVKKEVADAIESRRSLSNYTFSDFMKARLTSPGFNRDANILNTIPIQDLARILLDGYEIEKDPHEIVREVYNSSFIPDNYINTFNSGLLFALDTLGIKVKGVND